VLAVSGFERQAALKQAVENLLGSDDDKRAYLRLVGDAWVLFRAVLPDPALVPSGSYDAQDGVAVVLARSAHRAEPIRHRVLKPDVALAALVGFALVDYAAGGAGAAKWLVAAKICSASTLRDRVEVCIVPPSADRPASRKAASSAPAPASRACISKVRAWVRRQMNERRARESAPTAAKPPSPDGLATPSLPSVTNESNLPPIAADADDLKAIKTAVDDAAAVGGGLWLSYLFVLFYLAVAAGAVTHADLFFENPVRLPFLGIELPLLAFFFLAPILFVIVHAYTLVHLVMLTDKAKRFDEELYKQMGEGEGLTEGESESRKDIRDGLRRQLPSNIFVQFLAGPEDLRESAFGWALRAIAWITLIIAPVLLLLTLQIQFLPFHNPYITWTHRLAVAADLGLIWWLWRMILSGREIDGRRRASLVWPAFGFAFSAIVVLFSAAVVTYPGEWLDDHPVGGRVFDGRDNRGFPERKFFHDLLFNLPVDKTTRRRNSLFSSTLVLPGLNVYEGLKIDDPDKLKGRDYVFHARGRDLKGAVFDLASLAKVDFEGADLQNASFQGAQLQEVSLAGANLQGAWLAWTRFDKVSFTDAHLPLATNLQGASLGFAQLQGASLDGLQLQGAFLSGAHLEGASLNGAKLQGASLWGAFLQGASLNRAQLQGARLQNASLEGALLDSAQLQGAVLKRAALQGASLEDAQLAGASLENAQLLGASLQRAVLKATDLSNAVLWRTNRVAASNQLVFALLDSLDGSTGDVAQPSAVRFSDSPDQWLPIFEDVQLIYDRKYPWNEEAYQHLRQTMAGLPSGALRDQALDRIRSLDCASTDKALASCDPPSSWIPPLAPPPEAAKWRKTLEAARVNDAIYTRGLAAELKTLACSGGDDAIHVLRGFYLGNVVSPGPLDAAGPEAQALIDFIMSKDCPVSASLTEADKAQLLRIKENATKKPGQ
jgi:uncharacterized protein YjbI with pentapeptide repeats